MRLRLPLVSVLATALVVPATVVLPTVAVHRATPHPVAPVFTHVALSGVDPVALREEPVPATLTRHFAAARRLGPATAAARAASSTPAVLTARLSTAAYAMVGVTWLPDSLRRDLVVSLRARTDGRWSRWRDLPLEADEPSGRERAGLTRTATAPLWVGPSDGVQVRVDVVSGRLPRGLRVDLVDPGASPADAAIAARPPAGSAFAAAARPDIVTRAEWGADESLRDTHLDMSRTIKAAFVHHTAGSNDYTRAEAPAVIRGLLAYLTGSMGYADIPYNFLVDRFGTIYEGRYGSITTPVRQAATGGFNKDTMSVVAMGNFVSTPAPDAMVHSIAEVLAFRLSQYHRNPFGSKVLVAEDGSSRYAVGARVRFKEISGHMDSSITACPGAKLYQRLPEIRRTVKTLMGAGFIEPTASPRAVSYDDPTEVTVHARSLTSMGWTLTVRRDCTDQVVQQVHGMVEPGAPMDVVWRGRDNAGRPVPAGRYVVTLSGGTDTSKAVGWQRTVQVQVGSPGAPPRRTQLPPAAAGRYVAVTPTRLAVTSTGFGLDAPVLLGEASRVRVPVLGRAGVPASGVSAVALNVVAACAGRSTTVAVGPSGVPAAAAPTVDLEAGATAAGLAVTGVGTDGAVAVTNRAGSVSVALTVLGYWTTSGAGDGFVPLARAAVPGTGRGLPVGTAPVSVAVGGNAGVPADAHAVVLNVRRSVGGTADAVWVWPSGARRPSTAVLRRSADQPASQRVVVPLGAQGEVRLAADGDTRVQLDVVAYLGRTGQGFHPVAPKPLTGAGLALGAGTSARVAVGGVGAVPATADAVVLQLTGTASGARSRLFVYPGAGDPPRGADLTLVGDQPRSNVVVVPLGGKGRVRVLARDGAAEVALGVVGWIG